MIDKRTFLSILGLSALLFAVNLFFNYQNTQQKEEWLAKRKKEQQIKEKKWEEEISQRTVSAEALPLAAIYADESADHFITSGILLQDQVLTLSWDANIPKKIYVLPPHSQTPLEYTLETQQPGLGGALLYQKKKGVALEIETLPGFGTYDLQLVSFHPHNAIAPVGITLGQYADGHFSLPLSGLKQDLEIPNHRFSAIALFKTTSGYVPVGFYNGYQGTLVPLQEVSELSRNLVVTEPKKAAPQKKQEAYYVLENPYQQLVFSNKGGALVEINLPFRTEKNESSVVKEIDFDRQMVEKHPYNALFPAHGYFTPSTTSNPMEFTRHEKGQLGGYYPLIRRDLIQKRESQNVNIPPAYYALNIVSEYPELAELIYEVKQFTKTSITFEALQHHRRITKTYSFGGANKEAPYSLDLEIKLEGDARGLWLTTGVPEVEWISGAPAPVIKYRLTRNHKAEVENVELPKDAATITSFNPDWICNSNGFLGTILDPLTEIEPGYRVQRVSGTQVPSRLVEIDQEHERFKAADLPGFTTLLPLKSKGGVMKFRLYAGPFDDAILKNVDAIYSNPETGYNPDYTAAQTMHGWFTFISEPFAKFLLILMKFFHYITGSWALSIVLLTISLRIILYPLNAWSTKSMVQMQQIAPEVAAIQEKHKKDPKKGQMEIIALYRERGINPASGCLPLLIQMPFLIGMFDLLKSSFTLRGASFIPGWIDDLTAPDVLFSWNTPIFFIGTQFHLLPLLLGGVMFAQQKLFSTAPKDPSTMTDQQRQQKAMGTMMAVVFTVMFYNFPSGLNIYWLSSMLLGMGQQWWTTRKMQKQTIVKPVVHSHPKKK